MDQSYNIGMTDCPGNVSQEIMNLLQQLLQQAQQKQRQEQEQELRNLIANFGTTTSTTSALQPIQHLQGISSLLNGNLNPSHGPPRPPPAIAVAIPPILGQTQISTQNPQADASTLRNLILGTYNNNQTNNVGSNAVVQQEGTAAATTGLASLSAVVGGERLPPAGRLTAGVGVNVQPWQQASAATTTMSTNPRQKSGGGGGASANSSNIGGTIVPCRARGISKDHNKKTAYFVIPDNTKHGADLRCSHIKCQNKGIRFVYCMVCDEPVAKINFKTRHSHLDLLGPLAAASKDASSSIRRNQERAAGTTTSNTSSELPSLVGQKRKQQVEEDRDRQQEKKAEKRQKINNPHNNNEDSKKPSSSMLVGKRQDIEGSAFPSISFGRPLPTLGPVVAEAVVPELSSDSKSRTRITAKTNSFILQEGKILNNEFDRRTNTSATTTSSMTSEQSVEEADEGGGGSESNRSRLQIQRVTTSEKALSGNVADTTTDNSYGSSEIETTAGGVADGDRPGRATAAAAAASGDHSPTNNSIAITGEVESQWIALLRERPSSKKPKHLKAWIDRLLYFSERIAPPSGDDDSDGSDLVD